MPAPQPPSFPADCAARFEPVSCLASGGHGVVYEAIQRELGRPVAIKLLLADVLQDDEHVRRFQHEARIAATLEHPHIVRVLDHGAASGIPWIAYELVDGCSLRARLVEAGGGLDPSTVTEVASQIGSALDTAHAHGVLHRDLKPDNILSDAHGQHRLTDFGIAKWTTSRSVHTKPGVVLGTPTYMSPEQIRGLELGPPSDLYSFAVLLFELLTGRAPYLDENPLRLLEKHLQVPVPRVTGIEPGLPAGLNAVFEKALAKHPAEQWSSGEELAGALGHCLEGRSIANRASAARRSPAATDTVVHGIDRPAAAPPSRSPLPAAILATAAIASVLVWTWTPPRDPVAAPPILLPTPSAPTGIGRPPSEDQQHRIDLLGQRVQTYFDEVAAQSGSVAEMLMDPPVRLKQLGTRGLSAMGDGLSLLEEGQADRWTGRVWLQLDEILWQALDALGRCQMTVHANPRLAQLVQRLRDRCRLPAGDTCQRVVMESLPAYTVHVNFKGPGDFGASVAALDRAEKELSRLPDPGWEVLDARIRMLQEAARYAENEHHDVSRIMDESMHTRELSDEEKRIRRELLRVGFLHVTELTGKDCPAPRRDRMIERLLHATVSHAEGFSGEDLEVERAVSLAARLCEIASPRTLAGAAHQQWIDRLAASAKGIGAPPPCGG